MHDPELDDLRARVDCHVLLERARWRLDLGQSTVNAAKYRDGPARIVIVTHRGKGWFDPLSDARGDVIALAQYLWGGTIGHARQALRPLAGLVPAVPAPDRARPMSLDAPEAWSKARPLQPGSPAWRYLTEERGLPAKTLGRANPVLREGRRGTMWALHRTAEGRPTGWEMRGPGYKGFAKGGAKALFWVGAWTLAKRVAVTESAIDALSLASLEEWPQGTVYAATSGGFGPGTAETLRALLPTSARLVAATDQGQGGELLADRLRIVAARAGTSFGRLRPHAQDWNAQLTGT